MKHILIFNKGFFPAKTYGGPVVSVNNLVKSLNNKFKFTIISSAYEIDGKTKVIGVEPDLINKYDRNINTIYIDKKNYNFNFISSKLEQLDNIDFVYVNSFFDVRQFIIAKKICKSLKIKLLIAPRGELEKNALRFKNKKKILYLLIYKFLYKNDNNVFFQATTDEEAQNIRKYLEVTEKNIYYMKNIPTFQLSEAIIHKEKVENEINIVFLSRIQIKKNLSFALYILKKIDPSIKIKFDIYGPIENEEYWQKCNNIITSLGDNIKTRYMGIINHEDIFETFSNYHLFFFPTLSENFGHVIYEALVSNCPILISDQTPWSDINSTNVGKAYPLNEEMKFIEYIENIAHLDQKSYNKILNEIPLYLNSKIDVEDIIESYNYTFHKLT